MGKVLLWEGRHTGSAHGMGEGGSVCLARPVLGEGVSAHGAGGHGVENRRQGGGVSGCQRRCMAAWGALLGEWGGRDLASRRLLCHCVPAGAACAGEEPVPLRASLPSALPALPRPRVQHLSQTVHLGGQA